MAAGGHFGFWPLLGLAHTFARGIGAQFFLNTSKYPNPLSNLPLLSVVTGGPNMTLLVNENTNKSAYWYTSHKSSIPGFGKPGIVAEICPSGFVHASYLPSDWLTLVWTHPLSQIGNNTFFPNHDNWVVPFTCCGSQCCLAPKCFLLKIKHFGWFP